VTEAALSHPAPRWWSGWSIIVLVAALAVCLGAGGVGSLYTMTAIDSWYAGLAKPAYNPPNAVFGPVWSILYVLMAVAAWRAIVAGRRAGQDIVPALVLFVAQLVLNVAWSAVFFGAEDPGRALIVIALLWVFILATILAFSRIDGPAAVLLLPYLAWVTFASALNAAVFRLN
jgi:tryptophan-rich sensory protein